MPGRPRRETDELLPPEEGEEGEDPFDDAVLEDCPDEVEEGPEAPGLWDEDPPDRSDEDGWAGLEDEALALPHGRIRVGLWERVLLDGVLDAPVVALMDTGSARTRLVGPVEPLGPGRARVSVAGQWREVSGAVDEEGALALSARLHLAGREIPVTVRVEEGEADVEAVLRVGRDALSGSFVVDVAGAFLHGARGPVEGSTP